MACAQFVKNRLAAALAHRKQRKTWLAAALVRTAFSQIHPGRAAPTSSKSPNPSRLRCPLAVPSVSACGPEPLRVTGMVGLLVHEPALVFRAFLTGEVARSDQ